ncbi:hypothetical protein GCM10010270_83340 [Streptomyces violaceus]|nr:hypothetical protein GCM10010270_83340 [Streptomyces janthinus]
MARPSAGDRRETSANPLYATVQVDYHFDPECIWIHHGQWGTFTWSGGMGMKPNYVYSCVT